MQRTATHNDDLDVHVTVGAARVETAMMQGQVSPSPAPATNDDLDLHVLVGAARVETAMMQGQVSPRV
jgi:hypothetical protein